MSDLKFSDEQTTNIVRRMPQKPTGLTGKLVRVSGGIIRTESQANVILLVISILVVIFSLNFIFQTSKPLPTTGPGPSYEEIEAYNKVQQYQE